MCTFEKYWLVPSMHSQGQNMRLSVKQRQRLRLASEVTQREDYMLCVTLTGGNNCMSAMKFGNF